MSRPSVASAIEQPGRDPMIGHGIATRIALAALASAAIGLGILAIGMGLSVLGLLLFTQLPLSGSYAGNILPGMLLVAAGSIEVFKRKDFAHSSFDASPRQKQRPASPNF